jgi:hypothetical protein
MMMRAERWSSQTPNGILGRPDGNVNEEAAKFHAEGAVVGPIQKAMI